MRKSGFMSYFLITAGHAAGNFPQEESDSCKCH
jgi:hypothetical protein